MIIKANIKKRNGKTVTVTVPSRRLVPLLKKYHKASFRQVPGGFVSVEKAMAILPDEINVTGFRF